MSAAAMKLALASCGLAESAAAPVQPAEKETLAKIQRNYSFNVIDPAFVPDRKFKPKRAQICILSVVVAFFFAAFLAFFLEYLHNLKRKEDPERLAALRASLWRRTRSNASIATRPIK